MSCDEYNMFKPTNHLSHIDSRLCGQTNYAEFKYSEDSPLVSSATQIPVAFRSTEPTDQTIIDNPAFRFGVKFCYKICKHSICFKHGLFPKKMDLIGKAKMRHKYSICKSTNPLCLLSCSEEL